MRRFLIVLALAGLSLAGVPPQAAAREEGRAVCEAYCAFAAGGCFVFVGFFGGRDKCEAMYEGCIEGCVAALQDPSV